MAAKREGEINSFKRYIICMKLIWCVMRYMYAMCMVNERMTQGDRDSTGSGQNTSLVGRDTCRPSFVWHVT